MPALDTRKVGHLTVDVIQKSITDLPDHVDALVSSDDNYLTHGGGVSAALWRRAGPGLVEHSRANPATLRLGDIHVTPAGNLCATWLLHAITIDFDANRRLGPHEARVLAGAIIDRADELGCRTVAMPLFGSGGAWLDPVAVSIAIAEAIDERADLRTRVEHITLAVPDDAFGACVSTLSERLPERDTVGEQINRVAALLGDPGTRLLETWRHVDAQGESTDLALIVLFELALRALAECVTRLDASGEPIPSVGEPPIADASALAPTAFHAESLIEMFERARNAASALGHALPQPLCAASRAAIVARNKSAHHSGSGTPDDQIRFRRTMLTAVRQVIAYITSIIPLLASALVERHFGGQISHRTAELDGPAATHRLSTGAALGVAVGLGSFGTVAGVVGAVALGIRRRFWGGDTESAAQSGGGRRAGPAGASQEPGLAQFSLQ